MFFKKKRKDYGLGYYLQRGFFVDDEDRKSWLYFLQAACYRAYISKVANSNEPRNSSVENILDSHYRYLRNYYLGLLKDCKNRNELKNTQRCLLAVRGFKLNSAELLKNARKDKCEM